MDQRLRVIAAVSMTAFAGVLVAGSADLSRAAPGFATPCAQASPAVATAPAATPCPILGDQVALGTPAAADGMTVNLSVSSDQAGPVTLAVRVTDEHGEPVSDASVVVKAKHLEMDMGEFPHQALPTASGTYTAEGVGMGMGGHWRVEVDVARPGYDPVAVFFLVTMQGLS
jgi:hypothetical protein